MSITGRLYRSFTKGKRSSRTAICPGPSSYCIDSLSALLSGNGALVFLPVADRREGEVGDPIRERLRELIRRMACEGLRVAARAPHAHPGTGRDEPLEPQGPIDFAPHPSIDER